MHFDWFCTVAWHLWLTRQTVFFEGRILIGSHCETRRPKSPWLLFEREIILLVFFSTLVDHLVFLWSSLLICHISFFRHFKTYLCSLYRLCCIATFDRESWSKVDSTFSQNRSHCTFSGFHFRNFSGFFRRRNEHLISIIFSPSISDNKLLFALLIKCNEH